MQLSLSEDEVYRASTQYRSWSFTPETLASLRHDTNRLATERVKDAFKRLRESRAAATELTNGQMDSNGTSYGAPTPIPTDRDVDCLTPEEELKLVEFFCEQCINAGRPLKISFQVVATAIQYLKRFYLYNSPMTYHPKSIMLGSLFLASKTDNFHLRLDAFASGMKSTREEVLAPEHIITQGLRFTFDVRHPHKGLNGGNLELLALAKGNASVLPGIKKLPAELREEMLRLPPRVGKSVAQTQEGLENRISGATYEANNIIRKAGVLTDAYFLYTPSQIWLAAYKLADEPLFSFYISTKFPDGSPLVALKPKIMATINSCTALLKTGPINNGPLQETQREIKRIMDKLKRCQNPEKIDLVGLNKAQKRQGQLDGQLDENVAKRRKLEREKSQKEAEDFWGPELKKP